MSADPANFLERCPDKRPQSWRGWWLARPKWLRIACWAIFGMVLLHVMIAIRMAIGFQEDPVVVKLKAMGHHIKYPWMERAERFRGEWLLMDGLLGRSARHVRSIHFDKSADESLLFCVENLPNLESLSLTDLKLSADQSACLRKCRTLRMLNLADSEIRDQDLEFLSQIPTLEWICLEGTDITDAAIPLLNRLPNLQDVLVSHTAISRDSLLAWRASPAGRRLKIDAEKINFPDDLSATVRFADGRQSSGCPRVGQLFIEGPLSAEKPLVSAASAQCWFWSDVLHWPAASLAAYADGDYRYLLRIDDYESEPVRIRFENGRPSTHHFVFQMPVSKHQSRGKVE